MSHFIKWQKIRPVSGRQSTITQALGTMKWNHCLEEGQKPHLLVVQILSTSKNNYNQILAHMNSNHNLDQHRRSVCVDGRLWNQPSMIHRHRILILSLRHLKTPTEPVLVIVRPQKKKTLKDPILRVTIYRNFLANRDVRQHSKAELIVFLRQDLILDQASITQFNNLVVVLLSFH